MEIKMDTELFELACQAALRVPPKNSVGTLSEHRLHNALKYYVQPDKEFHEVKVEGFVCDAVCEEGVWEIQTRSFQKLRKKLAKLLLSHKVTIIYPVVTEKRILVTYEESGECNIRKSPKKATVYNAFSELYDIREHILNENLSLRVIFVTCDDHRLYKGTKEDKKAFAKPIKTERIPTALVNDIQFNSLKELRKVFPAELPENFDSKIFSHHAKIPRDLASMVLRVSERLGIIEHVCTIDRKKFYRFCEE